MNTFGTKPVQHERWVVCPQKRDDGEREEDAPREQASPQQKKFADQPNPSLPFPHPKRGGERLFDSRNLAILFFRRHCLLKKANQHTK
ncbi:hypothetical protein OUZ56_024837 [Daphnia magna]|uniref:Uncharacterized protein n=1 Tax=Daphnia magna TaxID=35525 RepID=A0ABQ9ZI44_9CRUS|nr:hypothetical protein OUZ56_024837 [Daphnia magna]